MFSKWITTKKAAEYTGFSKSTLDKLRCKGGGPLYAKLGTAVRYRLSDLEDWMSNAIVQSTSQASPG
jgi:excisionase family DNA binding protein